MSLEFQLALASSKALVEMGVFRIIPPSTEEEELTRVSKELIAIKELKVKEIP